MPTDASDCTLSNLNKLGLAILLLLSFWLSGVKIVTGIFPAIVALAALASVAATQTYSIGVTYNTNLRDGSNRRFNHFGLVRQSEALQVIDRTACWISVNFRDTTGWINTDDVVAQGNCG